MLFVQGMQLTAMQHPKLFHALVCVCVYVCVLSCRMLSLSKLLKHCLDQAVSLQPVQSQHLCLELQQGSLFCLIVNRCLVLRRCMCLLPCGVLRL